MEAACEAVQDAATGELKYRVALNVTRAGLYRVSPLIGGAPAATFDAEAPVILTIVPGPAAAAASRVLQGACPP